MLECALDQQNRRTMSDDNLNRKCKQSAVTETALKILSISSIGKMPQ